MATFLYEWTNYQYFEEYKQELYTKIWKPNEVAEDVDLSGNLVIFDWLIWS